MSTSTFRPAASILREQLAGNKTIVAPGVYDGFTARLALAAGHKTLYMTGAGTSLSRLGQPDLALITLTEMLQNAAMIAGLDPSVPLIADADVGFGGPLSVRRTIKAYIDANIAGLHIEDQVISKRCGHLQSKQLVSEEEFVTRIRAAVAAREESGRDIVIIARTDALQSFGYDEAIKRLKAAIAVGADVAFFEAVQNEEQMRNSIRDLSPTPCLVNMIPGGATPILTAAQAQDIGYKIMIWPVMLLSEVYANANRALKQLKETGYADPPKKGEGLIRELFEVVGLDEAAAFDAKIGGKAYEKV